MKWIKLLIIVISLSLPIHSYACWDDDMDDDDEGWLFDNSFYFELDDDDDSSYSDDDGFYFYDDDETTDSNDDDDSWYENISWDDDSSYSDNDGFYFYDDETTDSNDDDDNYSDTLDDDDSNDDWGNDWNDDWGNDWNDDWGNDNSDDDWSDDNSDDDWNDDNSDDESNSSENSWNNGSNVNQKYYVPVLGEVCLRNNLPNNWPAQDKNNNCVSFVLEYAFNYLNNTIDERYSAMHHAYEMIFEELYGVDLATYGLRQPQMLPFFQNCGFSVRNIEYEDVASCINNGIPVVGTLKRSAEWAHECFVIGYIKGQDKLIIVNPCQGKIEKVDKYDFYGNTFFRLTK
mgnify:CR=1 FL=1